MPNRWQKDFNIDVHSNQGVGSSLSWSRGSWFYNYLCNQCISSLMLWVRIPLMVRCIRYNIMWYSLSVAWGRTEVFSGCSKIADLHNITEIVLKVALNTINPNTQMRATSSDVSKSCNYCSNKIHINQSSSWY